MTRIRPAPEIPDHEVLRKIGGGSYGEVYMASSVTGAMRAVKVVWREDFEDERTFEREFDGVLQYEPISRDHPGLVSLLHIGRSPSDGKKFYYYVMELGDDCETVRDFNPVEYEGRTLSSDMRQADGRPIDVEACIIVGISLAGALAHLHDKGLTHRDVKPANIIFLDGKAQLADIGLVAVEGGRSFVGTEGFVPPEGPGSAQADLYSLGKVLYEMATGRDRMDFPDLPEELPEGKKRKTWLALNKVICDVCEPRLSRRTITTAADLERSLRKVAGEKVGGGRGVGFWLIIMALIAISSLATFTEGGRKVAAKTGEWVWVLVQEQLDEDEELQPIAEDGRIRIQSQPEGAGIYDAIGNYVGDTPYGPESYPSGETNFQLRLGGYRTLDVRADVTPGAKITLVNQQLDIEAPPEIGSPWTDSLGLRYGAVGESHVSHDYVNQRIRKQYENLSQLKFPAELLEISKKGEKRKVLLVREKDAYQYTAWLTELCIANGLLTNEFVIEPVIDKEFTHPRLSENAKKKKLRPFRCRAYIYEFGSITINSSPEGANIMLNGEMSGYITPYTINGQVPRQFEVQISLDGYRPVTKVFRLKSGANYKMSSKLKSNASVVFNKPWKNGMGMEFMPVGDMMVSKWETRVKDFAAFVRETSSAPPKETSFAQADDHPVVNVSLERAKAFCVWLTKRERKQELITNIHEYRLPTDIEWSRCVNLEDDPSLSPPERQEYPIFSWGEDWVENLPQSNRVANVADFTLAEEESEFHAALTDYDDGFAYTAPVNSYGANNYGLKNLSGNVHEWVDDLYLTGDSSYVLRGGGWNTSKAANLYISSRNSAPPETELEYYGFRVILVKNPPPISTESNFQFFPSQTSPLKK